ncbi:MAG: sulfotransferase [Pseudomonadota bacterium]
MPCQETRSEPLKLIYVAGYGRSGTTLLDIAVGQQECVFAAGEITALPRHVWEHDEYCACRETVSDCGFWGPVVKRWQDKNSDWTMSSYGKLLERTEFLFSVKRLFSKLIPNEDITNYKSLTGSLFTEIAAQADTNIILDSSKLPGRASSIHANPDIEIYLVHVVRDGRGVAWSMMKPYSIKVEEGIQKELKPKPLWFTAARWFIVNMGAEIMRWRLPKQRSIRVRYEDFVANPEATVKRIMARVGEEYVQPDHGGQIMKPQHQVAGSRHRMKDELVIKKDVSWKAKMPKGKQFVFSILAAPLLWRYGYFNKSNDDNVANKTQDASIAGRPA